MAKKNFVFLIFVGIASLSVFAIENKSDYGAEDVPWLWMSTSPQEDGSGTHILEVVEVVEEEPATAKSGKQPEIFTDHKVSEPRFIGNLKNKLCRIGLGLGKRYAMCSQEESPLLLNRIKRSPQSFIRISDEQEEEEEEEEEKKAKKAKDAGLETDPGTSSRLLGNGGLFGNGLFGNRFFGSGLDGLGLNQLFNPKVSPSFGVHFGSIFGGGNGLYGGPYGGGYRNPLSLDLGPVSLNPFGGLRVNFQDGRPIIRPHLDVLVSPNYREEYEEPTYSNYNPYYYRQRYTRDAHASTFSPTINNVQSSYPSTLRYPETYKTSYPSRVRYPDTHVRHSFKPSRPIQTPTHSHHHVYKPTHILQEKHNFPKSVDSAETTDEFNLIPKVGYPPNFRSRKQI